MADWAITLVNLSLGNLRFDILVFSAAGVLIGAQLGAILSPRLPARLLKTVFALCVLGISPSVSSFQRTEATDLAANLNFNFLTIDTYELEDPHYSANPSNRCFFCKSELYTKLSAVARDRGIDTIVDGTNHDDVSDIRPGQAAAKERVATLAILAYTGWFTGEHFADSIGWPLALILFGMFMIGLSALAVRIDRDYLRGPDHAVRS